MKQTELDYRIVDDVVEVLDFRNAADRCEIIEELGKDGGEAYLNGVHYTKSSPMGAFLEVWDGPGSYLYIRRGERITKEHFSHVVETMKKAGARFTELRKAKAASETVVKTVKI